MSGWEPSVCLSSNKRVNFFLPLVCKVFLAIFYGKFEALGDLLDELGISAAEVEALRPARNRLATRLRIVRTRQFQHRLSPEYFSFQWEPIGESKKNFGLEGIFVIF